MQPWTRAALLRYFCAHFQLAVWKGVLYYDDFNTYPPITTEFGGTKNLNINEYGTVPNTENLPGIPARITAVHKERYEIVCENGMTHARLKTKGILWRKRSVSHYRRFRDDKLYPQWGQPDHCDAAPENPVQPQRAGICAQRSGGCGDFDYVFIMQSLNMDFNPKRLERYLTRRGSPGQFLLSC